MEHVFGGAVEKKPERYAATVDTVHLRRRA